MTDTAAPTSTSTELAGRRIAITGAATGIGLAAVRELAARGATIAAIYRSSLPPQDVQELARWVQCDLTDPTAVNRAFAEITEQLGGLDVLIHSAGLWAPATPADVTGTDLDSIMAINLNSTVFTNQAAYAAMKDTGGAIINLGSVEGVTGSPISVHYAVAKAGVHAWTRSAARAWAPQRVTVNAVAPCVDTTNADRLRNHFAESNGTDEDTAGALMKERMKALIPLGGTYGDAARDLCPMLAFLSSDGARFITGQLLAVDGGMRMLGA